MINKITALIYLSFIVVIQAIAQETFPVNDVQNIIPDYYAFTNAYIVVDYEKTIEHATMIIHDGIIENIGTEITIPANAVIIDLRGKYIYPSFVDIYSTYGISEIIKTPKKDDSGYLPQMLSDKKGAYGWNEAIRSEINACELFKADTSKAAAYRNLGFGTVLSFSNDGIARGSSALVSLANDRENKVILVDKAAAHYSFRKGSSSQDYPSSLMGAIALLRQTYADAFWYEDEKNNLEFNISLNAWNMLQHLPQIFEADDKYDALRADKLGEEFGIKYIIKGGSNEYQRISDIKKTTASFILPLNFPNTVDVEDPYDAIQVSLGTLKHWELAPGNPAAFEKAQIPFALTSHGLKDLKDFYPNLRKAIKYGLTEKEALKALTFTPAKLINADHLIGSLKKGMLANFIITSSKIFDENNIIYQNWIQGKSYDIIDIAQPDLRGTYELRIGDFKTLSLKVSGKMLKPELNIESNDTSKIKVDFLYADNYLTMSFKSDIDKAKGFIRLNGWIENNNDTLLWRGDAQLPDGSWVKWSANFKTKYQEKENKKDEKEENITLGKLTYPLKAYGWEELPKRETIIIKNVTVWTNEDEGVLSNTDVLLHNGKIHAIGSNLNKSTLFPKEDVNVKIINAKGKHLTAGIIDEHSHIAVGGSVNEGTQSVSAEVSIEDVIDPDDINVYRQLSGGVTSAQLLHGSANPIGGQSAIIKFRWGVAPDTMLFGDANKFIKFALGENVKQSNWGDKHVIRFPQTRMGVEQVILDAFTRAKEYDKAWDNYNRLSAKQRAKTLSPRTDYELETLLEILNGERFITCHSYVQSEINMLIKLADSLGFKVNTFTHILEGYKVADKMKEHGVGASTFSDWWAYKYEVIDAVPYNGAILNKMGIITAYNSDDAEMGRRLNQEAAKAVKYGNLLETDALKFVTLNPAKLLHIDYRVGSITVGKDADVVLWTDNPLSIYAKVEQTYVDGVCYYDFERDKIMREEIKKERNRLIQKMIEAKKKGEKTDKADKVKEDEHYRCDDFPEE